jgi:uncharacterized protein
MPALPEGSVPEAAVSRRKFLGGVAAGAGIVLVGGCRAVFGGSGAAPASIGPLVASDGLLELPQGFRYRVLAEQGVTLLESGDVAPSDPDGAAAFPRRDGPGTVLICNHEVGGNEKYPVPHVGGLVYDPSAGGGTTTLVVDPDGTVVRHYVSLAGTVGQPRGWPHVVGDVAELRGDREAPRTAAWLCVRGRSLRRGCQP